MRRTTNPDVLNQADSESSRTHFAFELTRFLYTQYIDISIEIGKRKKNAIDFPITCLKDRPTRTQWRMWGREEKEWWMGNEECSYFLRFCSGVCSQSQRIWWHNFRMEIKCLECSLIDTCLLLSVFFTVLRIHSGGISSVFTWDMLSFHPTRDSYSNLTSIQVFDTWSSSM